MKNYFKWLTGVFLMFSLCGWAQEKPEIWDLRSCIDYAHRHNIQIKKSRISLEESVENTNFAKAQRLPSLSFSTGQEYMNRPKPAGQDANSYNGSYSLSTSVTLYNGGKLQKSVEQTELQNQVQSLTIKEAENNIELAITEAFIQVLYANETVNINKSTLESSKAQRDRGKELMDAGSISQADYAQLQAQYMKDQYQLVASQSGLENTRLTLKQLLELGISDTMNLFIPELSAEDVMKLLPAKEEVYRVALDIMPEIKYSRLNIKVADVEKEKAKAGFLPSLRLSAGIGTGHSSGTGNSFATQIKHSWNENVGLTLSIPIYSNRSNRTAVNLAQLDIENARLNYESVQKDMLKAVENVYQDAVSYQNQFRSAVENLNAVEMSYNLIEQQYDLGMKNPTEMLTEKNNLLTARQQVLQAKYMTILNQQLLNFYQGKTIELQ